MSDSIPKADLLAYCDRILAGVRKRARMYGATWHGVEIVILETVGLREFVLCHPHEPPRSLGSRWTAAQKKALGRSNNGFLIDALTYDGVTDEAEIQRRYNAVLDQFEADHGLYGFWLRHGRCAGCRGEMHKDDEPAHCTGGCGTWPCDHTDGEAEVARWRNIMGIDR